MLELSRLVKGLDSVMKLRTLGDPALSPIIFFLVGGAFPEVFLAEALLSEEV